MKNVETFGVSLHQAVLNSVVHHLYKMACARWSAVKISVFDGAGGFVTSRRARNITAARRQRFEDGIEMPKSFFGTADHRAVAAFQSPHAAAGPYVHIVDALIAQGDGTTGVVFEVRVAAVDDDIVRLHAISEIRYSLFCRVAGRYHDPNS